MFEPIKFIVQIKIFIKPASRKNLASYLAAIILILIDAPISAAQEINPTQLQSEPRVRRRGAIQQLIAPEILLIKPSNANRTYIRNINIEVKSNFNDLLDANNEFIRKVSQKDLSVSKLYDYAIELQNIYSKHYPLVRLRFTSVPTNKSPIVLEAVDNEIIDIDYSTVPESLRGHVFDRLEPLLRKPRLNYETYQRQTLLLGTVAGISGQTDLKYDKKRNGYVLIAQISEIPLSTSTFIDNRLPYQLGTFEATQSVGLSNQLGLGEQISFSLSSSFDFNRYFSGTSKYSAYSSDIVMPLGADGLTWGAGYYSVRGRGSPNYGTFTDPVYDFIGQRFFGHYERATTHLQYPLLLTNDQSVKIQGLYDHIINRAATGPGSLGYDSVSGYYFDAFRDRYNAGRVTTEIKSSINDWEWGGSIMALSIFSHGLGGRTVDWDLANNQLLSRPYTTPYFSKLGLKLKASIGLPQDFQLTLIGRSQTSFGQPLPITEMLSIDGWEAVSGYGAGTLNVDKGVTARAELSRLVNIELADNIASTAPYIFASYGRGQRSRPFEGEPPRLWAETFGGGIRADTNLTGMPFGETFSFEAGKNYSNIFYYPSGYRTNVSMSMKFAGDPGIREYFDSSDKKPSKTTKENNSDYSRWDGPYAGIATGYNWDPRSYVSTSGSIIQRGIDNYFLTPGFDFPSYADTSLLGIIGKSQSNAGGAINSAQVGFNTTAEKYLLGVEADISGLTNRSRHNFWNTSYSVWPDYSYDSLVTYVDSQKHVQSLATLRARVGYLFNDYLLAYISSGFAFGRVNAHSFISQQYTGEIIGPLLSNTNSDAILSQSKNGWTLGGGLEWYFSKNLSLKAEYLYYDLGTNSYQGTPIITTFTPAADDPPKNILLPVSKTQFVGDVVRLGLNYHLFDSKNAENTFNNTESQFQNGFYAGLNIGLGWKNRMNISNQSYPVFIDLDNFGTFSQAMAQSINNDKFVNASGAIGGGGIGYNHFFSNILLGAETDLQGASLAFNSKNIGSGNLTYSEYDLGNIVTHIRNEGYIDWLGTSRLRIGINPIPSLILYGTAGFAYGSMTARTFSAMEVSTILPDIIGSTSIGSYYGIKAGWVAGGGVEWLLSPNISFKGEYLYADIGKTNFKSNVLIASAPYGDSPDLSYISTAMQPITKYHLGLSMVRVGVNYHFDLFKSLPKIVN